MFMFKLLAGLAAIVLSLAVVTAVAVTPKGEIPVSVPLAKGDRLDIRPVATAPACETNAWPYGCQWQAGSRPVRRHVTTTQDGGQRARPRERVSQWKRRLAGSGNGVF
jgi:hypothetical protein